MSERVRDTVHNRPSSQHPSPDHDRHDRLLVTRAAAGDAYPGEARGAQGLIAQCRECAVLADEIRLLISVTAQLPPAPRTRDFQISPEEAASLRGGRLERLLRQLGGPSLAPLRPVAGVALSLGIVLAVAGAALPGSVPASEMRMMSGDDPFSVPADSAPPMPAAQPAPEYGEGFGRGDGLAAGPDSVEAEDATDERAFGYSALQVANNDTMRVLLIYGGIALALVSLGVLLLALIARRRTDDPLLR